MCVYVVCVCRGSVCVRGLACQHGDKNKLTRRRCWHVLHLATAGHAHVLACTRKVRWPLNLAKKRSGGLCGGVVVGWSPWLCAPLFLPAPHERAGTCLVVRPSVDAALTTRCVVGVVGHAVSCCRPPARTRTTLGPCTCSTRASRSARHGSWSGILQLAPCPLAHHPYHPHHTTTLCTPVGRGVGVLDVLNVLDVRVCACACV